MLSIFDLIKDSQLVSTDHPFVWKVEDENLGKLLVLVQSTQGVTISLKKIGMQILELVLIGTLSNEEYSLISSKLSVSEAMVKNYFKSWTKVISITSRKTIVSAGSIVLSTPHLQLYEFVLTQ